jgi:hypothetical protein
MTKFPKATAQALSAPVTEVAFFSLPKDAGEEAKAAVDKASALIQELAAKYGKCSGTAVGWSMCSLFYCHPEPELMPIVVEPVTHAAAPDLDKPSLQALVGYDSVEHHNRWIEDPKHQEMNELLKDVAIKYGLARSTVYGKDMCHGVFHSG